MSLPTTCRRGSTGMPHVEFDRYINDFTGEELVMLSLSLEDFNRLRFDMSMAIGHLVGKPVTLDSFEEFIDASQAIA